MRLPFTTGARAAERERPPGTVYLPHVIYDPHLTDEGNCNFTLLTGLLSLKYLKRVCCSKPHPHFESLERQSRSTLAASGLLCSPVPRSSALAPSDTCLAVEAALGPGPVEMEEDSALHQSSSFGAGDGLRTLPEEGSSVGPLRQITTCSRPPAPRGHLLSQNTSTRACLELETPTFQVKRSK